MEGYLLKWTNYVFGWQRRYFILHNGILHYCSQKGSSMRGAVHMDISQVFKHPRNKRRFYIDTGVSCMHLKAYSPDEAQDWFEALRSAKSEMQSDNSMGEDTCIEMINGKIGELWSIHAQIQASADLIPAQQRKSIPGLDRVVFLTEDLKVLASDTFHLIEDALTRFNKQAATRFSGDLSMEVRKQTPSKAEAFYEFNPEETLDFVDAQSHYSEEEDYSKSTPSESSTTRKCLPVLRNPNQKYNIWKVIKDSIGKDLSKIAVPVYFNEPLSMLQRFSEDLSYNEVVLKAVECEDPSMRLAYIAAFSVSSYASTVNRTMKPFNPLLGETFDLEKDGFQLITEQVSHHPPIAALHCDHPEYTFWGTSELQSSFKGTYLMVTPKGTFHLVLKRTGEHFIWSKPKTNAHNIIIGKIYLDHVGDYEILETQSGAKASMSFKQKGWFGSESHGVTGTVFDSQGNSKLELEGKWSEGMNIKTPSGVVEAWKLHPFPEAYEHNYYFTDYALQLNLPPEVVPEIPPTDSRFRPDLRALENGDIQKANSEKFRLEEKQRDSRKEMEKTGSTFGPVWFTLHNEEWVYKDNYWQAKASGEFHNLPDIF